MSKRTNLDIKDSACLHIVHNLQHPSSRPTTKSTQTPLVNVPRNILCPLPAGRYGKSTKQSNLRPYQANEGKSRLELERVRSLGALECLRSKKKLAAKKCRETHILSNKGNEIWIEDYVERDTAGARKQVEDADAVVLQQQADMMHAEIAGLTSREPEMSSEKMLVAIGDSLSDLASSHNGEDEQDEDDQETEQGKLSNDDEPCWVLGIITKMAQQGMEMFWQKLMKLDELTQPGWVNAATYFRERQKTYGTTEMKVPAVVQLQTHDDATTPQPTTFGDHSDCLNIVPGISQTMEGTFYRELFIISLIQ